MAIENVKNIAKSDTDENYSSEEKEALKGVDKQELLQDTSKMIDALKAGLVEDIKARNDIWLMKPEMTSLFDAGVLPNTDLPTQSDTESDASLSRRTKVVKQLLKNALNGDEEIKFKLDISKINSGSADRTAEEIVALHYFQLDRHIPGKSKPDAICGPLTMKDLLAANDVDLTEKIKEPAESVFVKYNGRKELIPQERFKSNVSNNPIDWKNVISTYKVGDKYMAETTDGKLIKLFPPIESTGTTSDTLSFGLPKKIENTKDAVATKKEIAPTATKSTSGEKVNSELFGLGALNMQPTNLEFNKFKSDNFPNEEIYNAFIISIPKSISFDSLDQTSEIRTFRLNGPGNVGNTRFNSLNVDYQKDTGNIVLKYGSSSVLGSINLANCTAGSGMYMAFDMGKLKKGVVDIISGLIKKQDTKDKVSLVEMNKKNVETRNKNLADTFKSRTNYTLSGLFGEKLSQVSSPLVRDTFMQKYFPGGKIIISDSSIKESNLYFTLAGTTFETPLQSVTLSDGKTISKLDENKWKAHLGDVIKKEIVKYQENNYGTIEKV